MTGPTDRIVDEIIQRIVDAVHPIRIVLFGSTATGRARPGSDIDLLVVMTDGIHRRRTAQMLHRSLAGVGVAKDIVVVTESGVKIPDGIERCLELTSTRARYVIPAYTKRSPRPNMLDPSR